MEEEEDYEYYEVPEDKVALIVYDALHASWHNPECQRNCQDFLRNWHRGLEFTAEDVQTIIKALTDHFEADNEEAEETYISPAAFRKKMTKATSSGPGGYSVPSGFTVPSGTTTTGSGVYVTPTTAGATSTTMKRWTEVLDDKSISWHWAGEREGRK